ncbi:Transposable element Tcb1 transposase [Anthophora retusa]
MGEKIICTDESKFNYFGSDGRCYERGRREVEEFDTKCLKSIVKRRRVTINGLGSICPINGITDQHLYVNTLDKPLIPFTQENMSERWIFQADPEHTSRKVKRFFNEHNVTLTITVAQFKSNRASLERHGQRN